MADSDPAQAPQPVLSPPSSKKNQIPISSKIADLNESRSELLSRIQGLKQDLQNWRSKLDTQVKIYRDELSELKKTLNVEVEQLRSEFQELRSTLQQQEEDVTASLRNLGVLLSFYFMLAFDRRGIDRVALGVLQLIMLFQLLEKEKLQGFDVLGCEKYPNVPSMNSTLTVDLWATQWMGFLRNLAVWKILILQSVAFILLINKNDKGMVLKEHWILNAYGPPICRSCASATYREAHQYNGLDYENPIYVGARLML